MKATAFYLVVKNHPLRHLNFLFILLLTGGGLSAQSPEVSFDRFELATDFTTSSTITQVLPRDGGHYLLYSDERDLSYATLSFYRGGELTSLLARVGRRVSILGEVPEGLLVYEAAATGNYRQLFLIKDGNQELLPLPTEGLDELDLTRVLTGPDYLLVFDTDNDLYRLDGSGAGAVPLTNNGNGATVLDHTLYAGRLLYGTEREIVSTDGTPAGTEILFTAGLNASPGFVISGDRLYFADSIRLLTTADGTAATAEVLERFTGSEEVRIMQLMATRNGIIFLGNTLAGGWEVYRADGTLNGTEEVVLAQGRADGILTWSALRGDGYFLLRGGERQIRGICTILTEPMRVRSYYAISARP